MSFIRRLTFVVSALVIALGGLVAGAQAPPFDLDTGDPLR